MTNQNEQPSDAKLESLLDELLAPEAVVAPDGLAERVFAATRGAVEARQRGVLARIGPVRWSALAAMILLVAGAALWLRLTPAIEPAAPAPSHDVAMIKDELNHLAAYSGPDEAVDHEITALAIRVERAGMSPDESADSVLVNLDDWDAIVASDPF
jgi:hypothetical protein